MYQRASITTATPYQPTIIMRCWLNILTGPYALWPRNELIRTAPASHGPGSSHLVAWGSCTLDNILWMVSFAASKRSSSLDACRLGFRRAQRGIGCLPAMALTSICDGQSMYSCSLGRGYFLLPCGLTVGCHVCLSCMSPSRPCLVVACLRMLFLHVFTVAWRSHVCLLLPYATTGLFHIETLDEKEVP